MFMDISSELIHSLLPVFMATVLGASMTTIGLVEGVGEATATIGNSIWYAYNFLATSGVEFLFDFTRGRILTLDY